jgi:C4-dicarboxylate-specific signal transduction histidine kinase
VPDDLTHGDTEIRQLRSSINDLISLQTLPAIWNGREPGSIACTLLEALVSLLRLEFAYLRLNDSFDESQVEFLKSAQRRTTEPQVAEIGRVLDQWLDSHSADTSPTLPNPAGDGEVRIAPIRLGLTDEIGVLVAGSKRTTFPTPGETLLLRTAGNQALAALQEARQLREQKRAADELEHLVAERTFQLTTANEALRESQSALQKAQAQLAHIARMNTIGELTASIAHEINQPLAAVVNNANACLRLLPNYAKNSGEVLEALNDIIDDANRASRVIARIRLLAKKAPFKKSLLDLKEVVQDVLALARYESTTRHITIRAELSQDLPAVVGDRVQLQQVLLNLLVNGMDAMNDVEEARRVMVIRGRRETQDGVSGALVSVRDSGTGFKPEQMDRLFEAFYTTKSGGLGLGLAISHSIIEAHGGRLWADPNQRAGATVMFRLPAANTVES